MSGHAGIGRPILPSCRSDRERISPRHRTSDSARAPRSWNILNSVYQTSDKRAVQRRVAARVDTARSSVRLSGARCAGSAAPARPRAAPLARAPLVLAHDVADEVPFARPAAAVELPTDVVRERRREGQVQPMSPGHDEVMRVVPSPEASTRSRKRTKLCAGAEGLRAGRDLRVLRAAVIAPRRRFTPKSRHAPAGHGASYRTSDSIALTRS